MVASFAFFSSVAVSIYDSFFFFFNDTATTEIYTLSLHDALPIQDRVGAQCACFIELVRVDDEVLDRKSTRLNSSHPSTSYAVFCLKKKKTPTKSTTLLVSFCFPRSTIVEM